MSVFQITFNLTDITFSLNLSRKPQIIKSRFMNLFIEIVRRNYFRTSAFRAKREYNRSRCIAAIKLKNKVFRFSIVRSTTS